MYKGPPSLALTEHWNYTDRGKDFDGYGDHMERLMYNGVISGISLAGTEYFYRNPVAFWGQDDSAERIGPRKPWFGAPGPPGTPCCPPSAGRAPGTAVSAIRVTAGRGHDVEKAVSD